MAFCDHRVDRARTAQNLSASFYPFHAPVSCCVALKWKPICYLGARNITARLIIIVRPSKADVRAIQTISMAATSPYVHPSGKALVKRGSEEVALLGVSVRRRHCGAPIRA